MEQNTVLDDNEATMPDAAIMDANIDDLFGEAADGLAVEALGVPLPSAPLPSSVALRTMEMQKRGCCTKVAWSNTGSIAQIKDRGRKIIFRALIRDMKSGSWNLTEESKSPIDAPEGLTWEHIQFSGIGIDLAAVDSRGSVSVFTLVGALGKMPLAPSNISPNEKSGSDLDAIVGMRWLAVHPTEFKIPYISPATKIGDRWSTEMRMRDASEPTVHHAADGRHALVHITRDAKFTLMYQNESTWHATSTKLESIDTSHYLLSHAAFGEEGDHLLLVTHDLSRRFQLYKISILWNQTQVTRPGGPPYTSVAPTLEIGHLTALEQVAAQQADAARVSRLALVPAVPSFATDPTSINFPTILAVFTRAPSPHDPSQHHQDTFSVISRWHVESVTPALHESFAKLKASANTPAQGAVTILRRQEDVITNKLVLSVVPQYYGTALAFGASDGTIEFRDRATMTSMEPYGDTTIVSSLAQSGFEQIMTEHHPHIAMSADGGALALVDADGTLTHKMMALRFGWQPLEDGISDTRALIEASVVCLARQYALLSCSSAANDETLALIPHDLSSEMRAMFIRESIKVTGRTLDISMQDFNRQQQFVIREPLLPRAFSAQFTIGTKPGSMERTWSSKFAFAFLNLRVVSQAIAQLVSRPDVFVRPDFIHSLRGVIKWACDMLVYVADSVLSFKRFVESRPGSTIQQAFADFITEKENPVINLLLCTFSRVFIRFVAQTIPKYLMALQRILGNARSITERQQLEETFQYGSTLPFKFLVFEPFISDVDTAVRNVYATVPAERRAANELSTMTEPEIPDELQSVVQKIMDTIVPKFAETVDMPALYFRDTSWIGMEAPAKGDHRKYDIIRKLPLTAGMKLRVCKRCGALMEDVAPERARELPPWFTHAQRFCVCGNYWIVG